MKAKVISLLIFCIIFTSFIFFVLIGMGGASQAVVDGVAKPFWSRQLYRLWACFLTPYLVYAILLAKDWEDPARLPVAYRSVARSAWLSFIGAIAVFIFVGSKIQYMLFILPFIQILITFLLYFINPNSAKT